MAKGDDARARNQINYQGGLAQNTLSNLGGHLWPTTQGLFNRYNVASDMAGADYADIYNRTTGGYGEIMPRIRGGMEDLMGGLKGDYGKLMGMGENLATTGGITPGEEAAMRARAVSPTRGIYAKGLSELNRAKNLQGGYMPNYAAGRLRMSRDLNQAISDVNVNTEAALAELRQKGRLQGTEALNRLFGTGRGLMTDLYGKGMGLESDLFGNTMRGLTGLYGTSPGMAEMFGKQALQSQGDLLQQQALQNQLGLGIMGRQIEAGGMPGRWEHTMGRIGDIMRTGAAVGGMF
jgi:hypothetical protein